MELNNYLKEIKYNRNIDKFISQMESFVRSDLHDQRIALYHQTEMHPMIVIYIKLSTILVNKDINILYNLDETDVWSSIKQFIDEDMCNGYTGKFKIRWMR